VAHLRGYAAVLAIAAVACQYGSATDQDGGFEGRYHPPGFAAADQHGPALKTSGEDCRGCHGYDLTGSSSAPSCDGCHLAGEEPTAWRARCTFCHGGEVDQTGAPPRDIDGDQPISFPAHSAHVRDGVAAASDCMQCHVKAIDVLSPGHIFDDDTPGVAEVDMGAGLSPQGSYQAGGCSNLYCHGSGRGEDGAIQADAGAQTCTSCHAGIGSDGPAMARMSGPHAAHLAVEGVTCATCHAGVSANGKSITDRALHLNGARDVAISEDGFTFNQNQKKCTGSCHGFDHAGIGWSGEGGVYHPAGFAAPAMHGTEMELQRQDCRGCHGADLAGGTAVSCDSCHAPGWRTDCTYCHGGGLNDTGAPPRDLGSANTTVSQSFVAHPVHVTQGVARASDCSECHRQPTDVMTPGHAFDSTPAVAEIDFSAGRSPNATYDGNGTCGNLYCHGNGRGDTGTATDGMPSPTCAGCHADFTTRDRWGTMSGDHKKHLEEGYRCQECHRDITADGTSILDPQQHIDLSRQVRFVVTTITWDPATRRCTGSCHESHNDSW
jgi:predicted CxxxxCH...CXXCH cytochrome family protein